MILVFIIILSPILFLQFIAKPWPNSKTKSRKLPPGPRGLPIIGNLHMLGTLPHQALYKLSTKYGDIMSIKLGNVPAIVVSSPRGTKLFLKTHDAVCASRPKSFASKYISYDSRGIAVSENGPHWRHLKKLCAVHFFSGPKVESWAPMRKEEMQSMIDELKKAAAAGKTVDFSEMVGQLMQNITYKMIFGKVGDSKFDLKGHTDEVSFLAGAFNVADFLPYLGALDPQGLIKRMKKFRKVMDNVLESIIEDHEREAYSSEVKEQRDFVDVVLSFMGKHISDEHGTYIVDRTDIKAITLDMVVGALDTSYSTIQWIFSELMRNPHVFKRQQEELDNVVGIHRMVVENDLLKLTYLDMVIKESYRLHPVGPFLIPHATTDDIIIDGHFIPKNSRILVNTYAIGRDLDAWSDDFKEFKPERFEGLDIDLRGRHFDLIPFGSGRRACPGMQLGLTTVRLFIASIGSCQRVCCLKSWI